MTRTLLLLVALLYAALACGPVAPPKNAYQGAANLLADLDARWGKVRSLRITGRVDHFGTEHRIQGKLFLFAKSPGRLRIDLLSPFGSTLSTLTVDGKRFALSDKREGTYLQGPAEPCNIARLIRIPLPADDVIRVLAGHTPLIDGTPELSWSNKGYYVVEIKNEEGQHQRLEVGPGRQLPPLYRSRLKDRQGTLFDVTYARWFPVQGIPMPHEIRVKMPREKADLLLRYDENGVELNIELPAEGWTQTFAPDVKPKEVTCN